MENKKENNDVNFKNKINEISKSIFKHIKSFDEKITININILEKDSNNIKYDIHIFKINEDKTKIIQCNYKKKHNSKRGLNSMKNLWHNQKLKDNKVHNDISMKENNDSLFSLSKDENIDKKDILDNYLENQISNNIPSSELNNSKKYLEDIINKINNNYKNIDEKLNKNEIHFSMNNEIENNNYKNIDEKKETNFKNNKLNIEEIKQFNVNRVNLLVEETLPAVNVEPSVISFPNNSMKNNIIDKKILLNRIQNIHNNIERLPNIFNQLYYLCKDYKENKLQGNFRNEFNIIQKKVLIIKNIITYESKYILDIINK